MTPPVAGLRTALEIGPDHPLVRGRTGRGISVAVVDSGVNPGHPHVGRIAGGLGFGDDASYRPDLLDRLGHGTAVVAAIQEKAPDCDLYVVKVFDETLSTTVEALARALEWSAERGVRLVNLSLGTANPANAERLTEAVERARRAGTLVVSAREHAGRAWYPGSLPGALGVERDPDCPREALRLSGGSGGAIARAAEHPRPIPGVPPERNLRGVSFAVANATGVLARLLEDRPEVTRVEDLVRLVG